MYLQPLIYRSVYHDSASRVRPNPQLLISGGCLIGAHIYPRIAPPLPLSKSECTLFLRTAERDRACHNGAYRSTTVEFGLFSKGSVMRTTCLAMGILSVITWGASTARADWPNFRGPSHDGISDERGLQVAWKTPIPTAWDRVVGSAYSSFACVGDRVYTCGTQNEEQVLLALDADSGRVIWQSPIEKEYKDSQGSGPRATPTVHDGLVYVLGAHGRLVAYDVENGNEVWSQQFNHRPTWGYSGSVLIEGDLAIVTAGMDQGSLAAFDKKTGSPKWKCGDDPAGYATPYPFTFNDKRYIAGFTGSSAIIADAVTGTEVWKRAWQTDWNVNASAPIFSDGHLFLSSGYRTGCALLKLAAEGDKLSAKEVWRSKVLLNKFQSCILRDGKLYTSDQKALKCVDFLTGKEQWHIKRMKHGTLLLAQDHLFVLTQEGQLQIAPISPEGFSPTTNTDIISDRCWTVPVIHRGRLYARNLERIACFDLAPKSE